MAWYLLDHTRTIERESILGFSKFEGKGRRQLKELPRCTFCRKQVWMHAVVFQEKFKFTGSLVGDAAWGFGMDFVVSQRFVENWRKEGMLGLNFSESPVSGEFKSKVEFFDKRAAYYQAFPEPSLARFTSSSRVLYRDEPSCVFCSSAEVIEIELLSFENGPEVKFDCWMPSCLPGWVVVSDRFITFIEKYRLINFVFMESFHRNQDRQLNRRNFIIQGSGGCFESFSACSDSEIEQVLRKLR